MSVTTSIRPPASLRPPARTPADIARSNALACVHQINALSWRHAPSRDAHADTLDRLSAIRTDILSGQWHAVDAGLEQLHGSCLGLTVPHQASRALSMLRGAIGFAAECRFARGAG